jgi:uncharacterized protein (TIGR03437 family)
MRKDPLRPPGSIVVIYATGTGRTNPPGTDRLIPTTVLPKPLLPVAVQVGGAAAQVLCAGGAPGLISGVLQVNCPCACAGRCRELRTRSPQRREATSRL